MYIYIYIYIYVCVCIYIYVYMCIIFLFSTGTRLPLLPAQRQDRVPPHRYLGLDVSAHPPPIQCR